MCYPPYKYVVGVERMHSTHTSFGISNLSSNVIRAIVFTVLLIAALVSPRAIFAQKGAVYGSITDAENGSELIGANVMLVGTNLGAASNVDGKYRINNVPAGKYTMKVSYIGYTPKTITDITVSDNKAVQLDISLAAETYKTDEIVITAQRIVDSEAGMLAARKKAASIGDGITVEQVKRSPDATSADALKRVTGITIMDDKFVYVRGVTDRYNGATLNGVAVTSTDTDVDKKSFAFDMIPSNLLTNLNVVKTATPDLPGDFTGGLVQVNTLEFPENRTVKFNISSSMNSITTGEKFLGSAGGGTDWLGFDDGFRAFPKDVTDTQYDLPRALNNSWGLRKSTAPVSPSFSISAGDRLNIGGQRFGYVGAFSYKNTYSHRRDTTNYFNSGSGTWQRAGFGANDKFGVLWGSLLNLSYQADDFNKVKLTNSFNQSADEKVTNSRIVDVNENLDSTIIAEWSQRSTYVGTVGGEHFINAGIPLQMDWKGSYSSSIANEPDRRTFIMRKSLGDPNMPYVYTQADRSWSRLAEFSRSAAMNFESQITSDIRMKSGLHHESKNRSFQIEYYYIDGRNIPLAKRDSLLTLPMESIFSPDNFGSQKFYMLKLSDKRDTYTGRQHLYAGYIMGDYRFSVFNQQFRAIGGLRLENSTIEVNTTSPFATDEAYVARKVDNDWLPSFNFVYLINDDMNFRLAYSKSVNRPEFRELSSFYFYDYNEYEGTYGNPTLTRAIAENYDARMEFYPGPGEVVAVSYFLKTLRNPIEQRILPSSNPERTWFNSTHGENSGWEIEIRKDFGFLGDYFKNIGVGLNYTRIYSSIDYLEGYNDPDGTFRYAKKQREMQGQSPWMINASLTFHEPTYGTTATVLMNQYGDRMSAVGDYREYDIIEESRMTMDVSLTQPVYAGVEAKLTAKDIVPESIRYRTRGGDPYRSIYLGSSFSFSVSYQL